MSCVPFVLRRSAVCFIAALITLGGPGVLSAQQEVREDGDGQPRLSSDRPRLDGLDNTDSVSPPRAIPRLRAEVDRVELFDTAELRQQRQVPPVQRAIAGPDTFGYVSVDSSEPTGPVFNFIDISATGTDARISGNDVGSAPLAIGFVFNFYGNFFDQVAMSSNGYLDFNPGGDLVDFTNDCPATNVSAPDNSIYVLWDDLTLGDAVGQHAGLFQTFSPCPNTEGGTGDCAIFQWENAEHSPASSQFDFQVILYDNGNILMNFGPGNPEQGIFSTTGIENATRTDGLTRVCNPPTVIPDNFSVLFLFPRAFAAQAGESEPNNNPVVADAIAAGQCGVGEISPIADVDDWVASGASAGDLVFAYVDTDRSSTSKDSFLSVFANDGSTLIESDNNDGPNLTSSVVAGAIVPTAGKVFFEVRENGDNAEITPYELFQVIADPADTTAEAEPNDSPATATPVTATVMTGDVAVTGAFDFYSFSANAGDTIVVIMDDDPDDDTNLTDTEIKLLAPNGITVLSFGNDGATNDGNAAGRVIALTDGTYFLSVDNLFQGAATDTDYRFTVLVNCARVCRDDDGDGVCNPADACNGNDATGDTDGDGVCDDIDPCPLDNPDDSDGDGVCDSVDVCPGANDNLDANGNGTPDCQEAAPPPPPPTPQPTPQPQPPSAPQPAPDSCGCDGGTGGMMVMPMTLLGMGWLRRRARRRRR